MKIKRIKQKILKEQDEAARDAEKELSTTKENEKYYNRFLKY